MAMIDVEMIDLGMIDIYGARDGGDDRDDRRPTGQVNMRTEELQARQKQRSQQQSTPRHILYYLAAKTTSCDSWWCHVTRGDVVYICICLKACATH